MSRGRLLPLLGLWASMAMSTSLSGAVAQQESEARTLETESLAFGSGADPDPVRRFSETLRKSHQALSTKTDDDSRVPAMAHARALASRGGTALPTWRY